MEYYSAELSEKVIRGLTDNALKCKYNGGTVPMGYYMYSRGMRSIRGGKITLNIMNHLLKNRRYMGEYSYRDVVKEDGIPAIVLT